MTERPRLLDLVESRYAMHTVALVLLLCTAAFFLTYPSVITVSDESSYLRQALLFAHGKTRLTVESSEGATRRENVSKYPPGTSLLMTPWMVLFGWRGAFMASFMSFLILVLTTAQWLKDRGHSPLFSLGLLIYPATVVSARLAMSDLPSAALVTLALWQFDRGAGGRRWPMFVSGLLAGLSLSFRETNLLAVLPFFIGSMLRKERVCVFGLAGGLIGCAIRPLLGLLVFGNSFFVARPMDFSAGSLMTNLLWQLVCLVVLLPGGLIFAALYKGPREVETKVAIFGVFAFYSFYSYFGLQSGPVKAMVLGGRYFVPICPLILVAAADVFSRLRWETARIPRLAAAAALIAVASGAGAQFVMNRYDHTDAAVVQAIYDNTGVGSVVVTNTLATTKWLNELYGDRHIADLSQFDRQSAAELLRRQRSFYIVWLERSDSEFWRREGQADRATIRAIFDQSRGTVVTDRKFGANYHLWICRMDNPMQASLEGRGEG
jgi:4-amino-4-deoxy-L-arabinose transferase-like glycosyltransferase